MPLMSIFDISGSALTAQSQRMNVAASNLANADSTSTTEGGAYRAKQVMFEAKNQGAGVGGVAVTGVIQDTAPMRREYRPNDPQADVNGYVVLPNVNPVNEMVNMMAASRSYQANVDVMKTSQQMMMKTLTLGQ